MSTRPRARIRKPEARTRRPSPARAIDPAPRPTRTSKNRDDQNLTPSTPFPPRSVRSPVMFHEKELRRSPGTRLKEEPIPQIGDQLRLMVRHVQNPMGEMELSNSQRELEERDEGVWREIKAIHARRGVVKGRVMNTVNGGYAVGVAGIVGFLPNKMVKPTSSGSLRPPAGDLLPFRILSLRDDIRNMVLEGPLVEGGTVSETREITQREKTRRAWSQRNVEEERISLGSSKAGAGAGGNDMKDFWRRKGRGAGLVADRDVGAGVEKKETAPMEKEAADGRPMWGGEGREDGAKEQ